MLDCCQRIAVVFGYSEPDSAEDRLLNEMPPSYQTGASKEGLVENSAIDYTARQNEVLAEIESFDKNKQDSLIRYFNTCHHPIAKQYQASLVAKKIGLLYAPEMGQFKKAIKNLSLADLAKLETEVNKINNATSLSPGS